ncbi:MAG: aspartate--tRNA(Asn) ligase [Clostridia bacterium]|nr:aspartate--tRNA(Asn) ligase [Clostridia bacterium]
MKISEIKPGKVEFQGWIENLRDKKNMQFIVIRDLSGKIQVTVIKSEKPEIAEIFSSATLESTVKITGEAFANDFVKMGGIEVIPESVELTSHAEALPIAEDSSIDQRIDYRWIDLRNPARTLIFQVETTLNQAMRQWCIDHGYIEIHTPTLIGASSEGGSDVFEVKYFDRKAYLIQSPQFYKQMAMCAGFEKVFINTPVFRAEKSHTKKHATEFSGFDVELSYVSSQEDVMKVEEEILAYAIGEVYKKHGEKVKELLGVDIVVPKLPFPRVNMKEAYNILRDKCGMSIKDGEDFNTEHETALCKYMEETNGHQFFFVTEYPTKVRAFYTMAKEDEPAYSKSYDLYFKDVEITSGAQREHRPDILKQQIVERGIDPTPMQDYINFFKNGCPPHGGFGLGLDRLLMLLLDLPTIKEAMYLFRGPDRLTP